MEASLDLLEQFSFERSGCVAVAESATPQREDLWRRGLRHSHTRTSPDRDNQSGTALEDIESFSHV